MQTAQQLSAKSSLTSGKLGLIAATTLVAATTFSSIASASGSFGPSYGANAQNPYNLGKSIYHKKLTCSSCVLSELPAGKDGAMMALDKLKTDKQVMSKLNAKQRKAVRHYLSKRYKL